MLREEIGEAISPLPSIVDVPPQTELSGHSCSGALTSVAAQPHSALPSLICPPLRGCGAEPVDVADDLLKSDPLPPSVVGDIILTHRRYEDLRRARQRLDLQAKAVSRWGLNPVAVEIHCIPYTVAIQPLDEAIKALEKDLIKLGRKSPVAAWAKDIAGLSDRFLALTIGEAGRPISDYRNPACLWKRMGMAVIDGGRQRRVTGDAALVHGYVPRRRALMWNIGESILKQQIRKNEDGERYAVGPYGQVYIDRRAHEVATKGEKYSHARAKRYMEKRLLRELWKAWPK